MKMQFLNGGLANQAFQYIFARYYELSSPGEVMYLDDSYFALNTVHNGYELDKVFGVKPHFISECFDEDVWNYMLEEKRNGKSIPQVLTENGMELTFLSEVGDGFSRFNPYRGETVNIPANDYFPQILELSGNVYYHGYWINYGWFGKYREEFLKELSFPPITDANNREYLELIESRPSVSIHIRRGDYVRLNLAMPVDIFPKLIEQFGIQIRGRQDVESSIEKWTVFVFSDDLDWCKENHKELGLEAFGETVFVEGNVAGLNYIDMQLMSRCEGMIVSNSAFCYLAALLNQRKRVVVNPTRREILVKEV